MSPEQGAQDAERAELIAARRRIAQLESELRIARRAAELLKDVKPPKDRFAAISVMAAEKLSIQSACRILDGLRVRFLRVAHTAAV